MYKTLTLICLQHCLHYAPYNGGKTGVFMLGVKWNFNLANIT